GAGRQAGGPRGQKIALAERVDEPWILTPAHSWNDAVLADAFRMRGLAPPRPALTTFSVHLRASLLTMGSFLTTFPGSVLKVNAGRFSLKVLPIDLPDQPCPVAVVHLTHR